MRDKLLICTVLIVVLFISVFMASSHAANFEEFDFNGDGIGDVVCQVNSKAYIVLGGPSPESAAWDIGPTMTARAIADLDGDGNDDLVAKDTSGNLYVLFLDGIEAVGYGSIVDGVIQGDINQSVIDKINSFDFDKSQDLLLLDTDAVIPTVYVWISDDTETEVDIPLTFAVEEATEMMLSQDPDFLDDALGDTIWQPYVVSTTVQIANVESESILYSKFKNTTGDIADGNPMKIVINKTDPSITVTSPEDGSTTDQSIITVTGTVNKPCLSIFQGEDSLVLSSNDFSFQQGLSFGDNVIDISTLDVTGNVGVASTVTVNCTSGGVISGSVYEYNEAGSPDDLLTSIQSMAIVALVEDASEEGGWQQVADCPLNTGDYSPGTFVLNVPNGDYVLALTTYDASYDTQFYDGNPGGIMNPYAATYFNISAGSNIYENVDFFAKPPPQGSISGNVFDGSNPVAFCDVVAIEVVDDHLEEWSEIVQTDDTGKYTIPRLTDGNYVIRVSPPSDSGLAFSYHKGYIFEEDAISDPITITGEKQLNDINMSLNSGGKIFGGVSDLQNPGLQFEYTVGVSIFDVSTGKFLISQGIGSNGAYEFLLPYGSYRVEFNQWESPYLTQFFNNVYREDLATPVKIESNDLVHNIDFAVDLPQNTPLTVLDHSISNTEITADNGNSHFWVEMNRYVTFLMEIKNSDGQVVQSFDQNYQYYMFDADFNGMDNQGNPYPQGDYTYEIVATGPGGLTESVSGSFYIDLTPPDVQVVSPVDGFVTNQATITVSGTISEPCSSVIINDEVSATVDNTNLTFSGTFVFPNDGDFSIWVKAVDLKNNEKYLDPINVVFDGTPPYDNSINIVEGDRTNSETVQLTLWSSDVTEMYVSGDIVGVPAWEPFMENKTVVLSPGDGDKTISVLYRDNLNNQSVAVSDVITLDQTAPDITISSPADGFITNQESITIQCALNEQANEVLVNGEEATHIGNNVYEATLIFSEGSYSISAYAVDLVGNEATSESVNITVDTTNPVVTITSPVDGAMTNQSSVMIEGTISEECMSVVVNDVSATMNGLNFSVEMPLVEHDNYFEATAIDLAGNIASSGSVGIRLDTTPPTNPSLTIQEEDYTNNQAVTLDLFVENAAYVIVSELADFSDAIYIEATTPQSFNLSDGDGEKTIYAKYKDLAGNESSVVSDIITLDQMVPAITMTSPVDGFITNQENITVEGTVDEACLSVVVNGQVATIDGQHFSVDIPLAEGSNAITAQATDLANNQGLSSPLTVVSDTVAPSVTITSHADGYMTNNNIVTIEGTLSEDNVSVSVNGNVANVEGTNFSVDIEIIEGNNEIQASAIDLAENQGSSESINIVLDTTPPDDPTIDELMTPTNQTSQTISGTKTVDTTVITVTCSTATIGAVTYPDSLHWACEITSLSEGQNDITVTAKDALDNESAAAEVSIRVDTVAPDLPTIDPVTTPTNQQSQTIGGTKTTDTATITVICPTATVGTLTYPDNTHWVCELTSLTEGQNSLSVSAKDALGNESSSANTQIDVDVTPPTVTITSPTDNYLTNNEILTVEGTVDDIFATVTVNGQTAVLNGNNFIVDITLVEGTNTIQAVAVDSAMNQGVSDSISVTLDQTAPLNPIINIDDDDLTNNTQVQLSLSATDATWMYVWGDIQETAVWEPFSVSKTVTLTVGDGTKTIRVNYKDDLDNETAEMSDTITLDQTAPLDGSITIDEGDFTNSRDIHLTLSAVDATELYISGDIEGTPAWESYTTTKQVVLTAGDGLKTIQVIYKDQAANETVVFSTTTTLDQTAPVVTITAPSDGYLTNHETITVEGSIDDADAVVMVNGYIATVVGNTFSVDITLTEGNNVIQPIATDVLSNQSIGDVKNVTLDTIPPQDATIDIDEGDETGNESINLTLSATDGAQMYVFGDIQEVPSWESFASSKNVTLTAGDGTKTVYVRYVDAAGNETSDISDTIVLNQVLPQTPTATIQEGSSTNQPTIHVDLSCDNAEYVMISEDADFVGVSWEVFDFTQKEITLSSQGDNTIYVKYKDAQDTESDVVSVTITYYEDIVMSITNPLNATIVDADSVVVEGTFSGIVDDIYVNGVKAIISGTGFTAYSVPLGVGSVELTALAMRSNVQVSQTSVAVTVNDLKDVIGINTDVTSGEAPLTVNYSLVTDISESIVNYQWDFNDDGVFDYSSTSYTTVNYEHSEVRHYYPLVVLTTASGLKFSERVFIDVYPGVTVLDTYAVDGPQDLEVDQNRNLYVVDQTNHTIMKYDKDGTLLNTYGGEGTIEGLFESPSGISLDEDGNMFIADTGNNRIQKLDSDGDVDSSFGTDGAVTGIDQPYDLVVNSLGEIYVSSQGENKIKKYDNSGVFISEWSVITPAGLMCLDGDIYVANTISHQIEIYSTEGDLKGSFGGFGIGQGQFDTPLNMTYDKNYNRIIGVDSGNNRVQLFTTYDFMFKRTVDQLGLVAPVAIAADDDLSKQTIYIADKGNSRVLKVEIMHDTATNNPVAVTNSLKNAFVNENITVAKEQFTLESREKYGSALEKLSGHLNEIASEMNNLYLIRKDENTALYLAIRVEDDENYGYYVYYERDKYGDWKISSL